MTALLYKPDWEATKARYRQWWNHEYFGRCALAVSAPQDDPPDLPEPPKPATPHQQWYDLELNNRWQQYRMARTFYGGEALPIWNIGYPGNTSIPVFLGNRIELDWETGWDVGEPVLAHSLDVRALKIDTEHPDYRFALETLRRASAWARGKSLVTVGAFGGCGDTLAALRGTMQLLYDCLDRPAWVREADLYLMEIWCAHYETLYQLTCAVDEGSTNWFGIWAPGRFYPTHNDFSYMIGPEIFEEVFIPSLRRQLDALEYSVYHVDGIAAFAHVPALCRLERLQALQILPGAGKPSPLHYLDTLRYVQQAGKNLHITIPPDEVRPALEMLSARGLFISTWCDTESDARRLLDRAAQWSVDRG